MAFVGSFRDGFGGIVVFDWVLYGRISVGVFGCEGACIFSKKRLSMRFGVSLSRFCSVFCKGVFVGVVEKMYMYR